MRLFDSDADLALVEQLRSIRVFVHVRLLSRAQIRRVLQIVEQKFIQRTAIFVQNLNGVPVSVVHHARMDDRAESVHSLRIASPFVVHLLADSCKLDGMALKAAQIWKLGDFEF